MPARHAASQPLTVVVNRPALLKEGKRQPPHRIAIGTKPHDWLSPA
jgi:hypothetical protein